MFYDTIGNSVREQAKKNKEIIYGARSLKKQLGFLGLARSTKDYDVYSNKPKRSATQLEQTLDKKTRGNNYYHKPALHKGTWKVMDKGFDRKKNTQDDFNVADYSKPERKIKFKVIDGVRYSTIKHEVKNRKKSLSQKESSFRHEKDKYDLGLIYLSKKLKR